VARLERRDRPLGVQRRREGVVDEADLRIGQQGVVGVVRALDAEALGVRPGAAPRGHGGDDDVVASARRSQDRRRGDAGGAENPDHGDHEVLLPIGFDAGLAAFLGSP